MARGLSAVDEGAPSRHRSRFATAVLVRYRLTPWWLRVSIIFVASRILTTVLILVHASTQPGTASSVGGDYFSYANVWDAAWYHFISGAGYPDQLPHDPSGNVTQNAWAFMPVFPGVVRGLELATGLPWNVLSVFVSVVAAWATALLLYRLLRPRIDASATLFSIVLFCVAPLSPMLQVGYAESLAMLLLVITLQLVTNRTYGWAFPVIGILALTRPGAIALALALAGLWVLRLVRRGKDPFSVKERVVLGALAVWAGVMGLAWTIIAWIGTGSMSAYTDTELAWRSAYIGRVELVPFAPWIQSANWWFGLPLGIVILVLLLALVVIGFLTPAMRRLGPEINLWSASYILYLLAVFFPQSSTYRILMPLFPALGAIAQPRSRIYRTILVLAAIAGQWWWLQACYPIGGASWWVP